MLVPGFPIPGLANVVAGGPDTWVTVVAQSLTSASTGWNGYTMRQLFDDSLLTNTGGSKVRVTLEPSATQGFTIDNAFIGHGAASGDLYDFEAAPTRLTFGGGNSDVTTSANTPVVSDEITFTVQSGKNLIVAVHFSAASSTKSKSATAGILQGYYKSGVSEAGTVNVTGYTSGSSYLVSLVETVL